jgi:hypothetical protein
MGIFGVIESDLVTQQNDKLRISAKKSYVSKDEAAITLVEIEPEAGEGFVDVTGNSSEDWFLDWQYSTDGVGKVISLRITTDGVPVTYTKNIDVLSEADDGLFSKDEDIYLHETELQDFLPEGRASWKYVHRRVQTLILDWFDEQNFRDFNGDRLTKAAFTENDEVRKWSEAWALALIYEDLSNSVADKFAEKATKYRSMSIDARRRAVFRMDLDGDGETSDGEFVRISSVRLSRI